MEEWDRALWARAGAVVVVVRGDGEAEVVSDGGRAQRAAWVVSTSDFALTAESRSRFLQPWAKKRADNCNCLERDVWG